MAVTNIVDLVFRVTDNATGPANRLGGALSGLSTAARVAAGALGAIGVGVGIKEVIDLSSDYEKQVLNIASKLRAFGFAGPFEEAELATRSALKSIEDLAAKLPGEAADYTTVFTQIMPKAIASGMTNMRDIVDFTARYTAGISGSGIDAGQAAMDMVRMLSGQAGADVRTFTEQIRDLLPVQLQSAEAFNRLSAEARRVELDKVFRSPAIAEKMTKAADMLDSKLGEVVSKVKAMIRESSKPMFEGAKRLLEELSKFITDNEAQILGLGKLIGQGLQDAVALALPALQFMLRHLEGIARVMAVVFGFWAGSQLTAMLSGLGALAKQIQVLYGAMRAFGTITAITGMISEAMGKGWVGIASALGKAALVGGAVALALNEVNKAFDKIGEKQLALPKLEDITLPKVDIPEPAAKKKEEGDKGRKGPPKAEVYIENARFDIKQAFAEGYDPDRIAAAFVESIGSTALYPGQSGFAAAGTGA